MSEISVIVPVYKVEKYLSRCVDSILAQTYKDYELILVDDGSPDTCPALCDEYAKKYSFIHVIHKKNGGLSDARNCGIDYAFTTDSEWLTFIDSDDWVHPQFLELLIKACKDNGADVSSCTFEPVNGVRNGYAQIKDCRIETDTVVNLFARRYGYDTFNIISAWAKLYKKSLFEKIRYPKGKLFEDSYTTYKLYFATESKKAVVHAPLYYYFVNENGIMHSEMDVNKMEDTFDSYLEKLEFFHKKGLGFLFEYFFKDYCLKLNSYKKKYGKNALFKNVLLRHDENVKVFLRTYYSSLPKPLKKYGYKKWINGTADRLDVFWCDYRKIKNGRGRLFANLWAIKNYFKVRFLRSAK